MSRHRAFVQEFYPEDHAHCYGCGRLNPYGIRLESAWEGDEVVARYTPRPEQVAMPGFVYGGLIAALIDCHAMATASAHVERLAGREIGEAEAPSYVTAALHVDYLAPTPHGPELVLRARVRESGRRKQVVEVRLEVAGQETARGDVIAVPIPEAMSGTAPRRPG
ncbi:MAG: PaaI family thioesterase [Thermoanaerobaculia bacterium]